MVPLLNTISLDRILALLPASTAKSGKFTDKQEHEEVIDLEDDELMQASPITISGMDESDFEQTENSTLSLSTSESSSYSTLSEIESDGSSKASSEMQKTDATQDTEISEAEDMMNALVHKKPDEELFTTDHSEHNTENAIE